MLYSIIMAGGIGSRFWPMSRREKPKHILPLVQGTPLIEATIRRVLPLTPLAKMSIVTNDYQKRRITKILPWLENSNFIIEPVGRNTAPCIGLSAINIYHQDPQAVMIVLPADHIIDNDDEFRQCLKKAVEVAKAGDCLVTLGIPPTRVETGYGYIQRNANVEGFTGVFKVKTFAEKPNYETAERFIKSGDFYWNSGIFIWRADVILDHYRRFLPELYDQLIEIGDRIGKSDYPRVVKKVYRSTRGISIDYGIMERAPTVKVVEGRFGWGDIGSWEEAYLRAAKDEQGNSIEGEHILLDAKNCYINSPDKLVAVVGLDDIIVVQSGNAILVCHRKKAQKVKEVVEKLERMNNRKFL